MANLNGIQHVHNRTSGLLALWKPVVGTTATAWNSSPALLPSVHVVRDPGTSPWLTDAEVDDLCAGLTQNAAKIRYLKDVLKLPVAAKPNGRPLVPRRACERLLTGPTSELEEPSGRSQHGNQPNEQALLQAMSRR